MSFLMDSLEFSRSKVSARAPLARESIKVRAKNIVY